MARVVAFGLENRRHPLLRDRRKPVRRFRGEYCVDRDFVRTVRTPCLVLAGNDEAHPYAIAEELDKLLPNSEFIAEWKSGAALEAARVRVKKFLLTHTPRQG